MLLLVLLAYLVHNKFALNCVNALENYIDDVYYSMSNGE